ncbi:MAG TPA: hypothetical protein PLS22_08740 [Aquabacterium sp.]|nr:hypothetical protein [Aquabacterium sp.]
MKKPRSRARFFLWVQRFATNVFSEQPDQACFNKHSITVENQRHDKTTTNPPWVVAGIAFSLTWCV